VPCRQTRLALKVMQTRWPALASAAGSGWSKVSRATTSAFACRTTAAMSTGGAGVAAAITRAQGISLAAMRFGALVAALTLAAAGPACAAPSLLHVGDSLAVGSDPPLRQLLPGWSITTDALKSRPTGAGVAIIDRQASLPAALVVELGTNDSPDQPAQFASYVRHVLALAGPNRCVVWVNIHRPPYDGVSYAGFNRALDQIAASSANLAVVDWNGMVDSGQAQVAGDGVHATPDGYRARAAAIAQALQGCNSARGSSGGSHTIKPAPHRHAPATRKAKPSPKPAAPKLKPIKVYTPSARTATTAATRPAAARDTSASWPRILAGALAGLALATAGYAFARRRRRAS
jgi:hypothetical protein